VRLKVEEQGLWARFKEFNAKNPKDQRWFVGLFVVCCRITFSHHSLLFHTQVFHFPKCVAR